MDSLTIVRNCHGLWWKHPINRRQLLSATTSLVIGGAATAVAQSDNTSTNQTENETGIQGGNETKLCGPAPDAPGDPSANVINETGDGSPTVELRSHQFTTDSVGDAVIRGVVENASDSSIDMVEITVSLFDTEDIRIDRGSQSLFDLPPGQQARFEIITVADASKVNRYDLTLSTGL